MVTCLRSISGATQPAGSWTRASPRLRAGREWGDSGLERSAIGGSTSMPGPPARGTSQCRRPGARLLRAGRGLRLLLGREDSVTRGRRRSRTQATPSRPTSATGPHRGRRRDRCLLRGHQAKLSEHELEDRLLGGGSSGQIKQGPARPTGIWVGRQAGRVLEAPNRVSTGHGQLG